MRQPQHMLRVMAQMTDRVAKPRLDALGRERIISRAMETVPRGVQHMRRPHRFKAQLAGGLAAAAAAALILWLGTSRAAPPPDRYPGAMAFPSINLQRFEASEAQCISCHDV